MTATLKHSSWLALGRVAGPVLVTLGWFVLGFIGLGYTMWGTRIAPYSIMSQPLSGLGLGPTGPLMNAAFIASGLLIVAGAVGVFRAIPEMSPSARWIGTVPTRPTRGGLADRWSLHPGALLLPLPRLRARADHGRWVPGRRLSPPPSPGLAGGWFVADRGWSGDPGVDGALLRHFHADPRRRAARGGPLARPHPRARAAGLVCGDRLARLPRGRPPE